MMRITDNNQDDNKMMDDTASADRFWQKQRTFAWSIAAILFFGILLLGIIWIDASQKIQAEREAEFDDAVSEMTGVSLAFEEYTVSAIQRADQLLLLMKSQYEKEGRKTDILQLIKTVGLDKEPLVLLSIADENGDLIMSNQEPFRFSNIQDREHFQIHQEESSQELFISDPVLGRSSGQLSMQLTRRINKPDGTFGGIAVASLSPVYFTDFHKRIDFGNDGMIALVKTNGVIESWEPKETAVIGGNLKEIDKDLFGKIVKKETGTYFETINVDGVKRIYNYRMLHDYPLGVLAGKSENNVFMNFAAMQRKHVWDAILMTVIVLVACSTVVWVTIARTKNAESQFIVYKISEIVSSAMKLEELYPAIYKLVEQRIRAKNFYIVLYDQTSNSLQIPYKVVRNEMVSVCPEAFDQLAVLVIQTRNLYRADSLVLAGFQEKGKFPTPCMGVSYWIGAPLKNSAGDCFGVVAVFDTAEGSSYVNKDQQMLLFISNQIAMAIERKRIAEELTKSQERHRLAMEATEEGLWDYDLVHDEFYYSDRFAEMTGISPGQKLTLEEFGEKVVPHKDISRMHAAANDIVEGKSPYYFFEYSCGEPDDQRWIIIQGKAIYDAEGNPVRVTGSSVDITKRKKMELEIRMKNEALAVLNTRIQEDLNWAALVQKEALPKPFCGNMVQVHSFYVPYNMVSGDFFNYQWIEKNRQLRGYLVDVSGHGMAPALQMATLKTLLDSRFLQDHEVTESVFQEINRMMPEYMFGEYFAGVLYFEFDFRSSLLKVISAGIQFFLAAKPAECRLVPVFSGYLGMFDKAEVQTETLPFRVGEIYCLMSDGVSDLIEMHGAGPQKDFAAYREWIDALSRHPDRSDDFSAVCIEILPDKTPYCLEIRQQDDMEAALDTIHTILERTAPNHAAMLEVAVNEAVNNALRVSECVGIKIKRLGSKITIRVKDDGPGFLAAGDNAGFINGSLADAEFDRKFDELREAENGRGILMMKMFCDQVLYNARGNEVLMVKRDMVLGC
ncbi:MAG: protein,PAS protein,PAS protein [Firmicutes bacterium]|nr:protein,PAS protein,PAS protein [Bacillota bacterium]